ncbi:maltokinase N-terminal cap-like domain-containing protein [Pengzhenrongella sicca]|uniref:Maltokinase n=1 Tax=Pengzhenrongella sicca TaxID=2819238 RepID=A0A8A4ZGE5_9MICO|nr:aminoglycoside phosphotransferase [Pengzhenrongella sicca]QTE28728.1 aminoglycoside phosphotransferase [Pengzhenrongella sicca]
MTTPAHQPAQPASVSDAELLAVLRDWLPERRWFPAKDGDAEITSAGALTLVDPRGEAEIRILLVRVVSPTVDVVLQVPLSLHRGRNRASGAGWIATIGTPPVDVRDGVGDPAFLRAWLEAASGPGSAPADLDVDLDKAHVITGEQSNTSVILPGADGDARGGAILKIFRALTPGDNPDVDVPRRLAADGWWHVPRPLGWLEGSWSEDGAPAAGHLAVLSEFVTQAADGFELACDLAGRGESFADLAADLGAVVASMHRALAAAIPVAQTPADAAATELAASLAARFRWARGAVPGLDAWAPAVAARVAHLAARTDLPNRQRVHGDLHLGQALRARGEWFITDFEGEPLSTVADRTRPDLALRDIAGVLRSIDYAAAVSGGTPDWIETARASLLAGYATSSGTTADAELLEVLELDKALYEAVYEARNRPQWTHIPAAALTRLLGPGTA